MNGTAGSDQPLADLLDALPERIALYRARDLTILYCNAAKAADYGRRPRDLIGRLLRSFLPESEFTAISAYFATFGPHDPIHTTVNELRRPGTVSRWIEWHEQWRASDDGGEIISVGRDVTDDYRGALARANVDEWFRTAMDDAPIGMAIVGSDHRLLRVNNALCAFLGRSEDELLGLTTLDITHPDDVDADLAYGHTPGPSSAPRGIEKRYLRPDGTVVWGLLKASTVYDEDGRTRYTIGQVVDITDRIEREATLEQAVESQQRVAEQLRALDRAKNTFLTAVTHELRTPVTVIRGMAATLQRIDGQSDAETRASLEVAIERHAERLGGLLDELLDVDLLAQGPTPPSKREVDLVELVRATVDDAPSRHRIDFDGPAVLPRFVDPNQIERMLRHLLDNAAKYAPDGPIDVRLTAVGVDGFRLEVIDQGPGIPADDRERVFVAFHRVDGDDPRPGTGIGLALVAQFAALHGGRAWVEPSEDGGHIVVAVPATDSGADIDDDGGS